MSRKPDATKLAACPQTPNCVSSQATTEAQRVDPFPCDGSCEETLERLHRLVAASPGASIVAATPHYLHAEYRSAILRFVDDLELLADGRGKVIHVRSASRVGSWDLGANRRRVEALRRRLAHQRD